MEMNAGRIATLIILGVASAVSVFPAASATGQEGAAAVLNASQTVRDNLVRLQQGGKRVELTLKNGKSYAGKLGAVGDHAVVVTEITGREFFDAYVVLDDISAVEVRARDH